MLECILHIVIRTFQFIFKLRTEVVVLKNFIKLIGEHLQ